MKIDGGCHCGAITYEAEIDPDGVRICHCTDCQTLSGTAFRVVVFVPADKFSLSGTPKEYVKVAESGAKRAQAFCGECGTPIYATAAEPEARQSYGLRAGAIRQREDLAPNAAIWGRSSLKWLDTVASLPTAEKQQ